MERVLDTSFTDWAMYGMKQLRLKGARDSAWRDATWAQQGLEVVMDTVLAAGIKTVNFRLHSAGPYWPTQIKDAGAHTAPTGRGLVPDFKTWNLPKAAVQAAHKKGIRLIAWFDLTEGHAGIPTKWALNHPQYSIVNRQGIQMDGPLRAVNQAGEKLDISREDLFYDRLLAEGYIKGEDGARQDGVSIDPYPSLAYPQVIEYRLELIKELLSFGVDGLFLVANQSVGYEEPSIKRFRDSYGVDPRDISEEDTRWLGHRRSYVTELIRQVNGVVRAEERSSGRKLQFIFEGQSDPTSRDSIGSPLHLPPEPGWPLIPRWASMPSYVDIDTIAREGLVDALSFFTFKDIDTLDPEIRKLVNITMRFRFMGERDFTEQNYRLRLSEAEKRGLTFLSLNEPRWPLGNCRWMYPGQPGPFYDLVQQYSS